MANLPISFAFMKSKYTGHNMYQDNKKKFPYLSEKVGVCIQFFLYDQSGRL